MPVEAAPARTPATVRQQTVSQSSNPARELAVNMPLQSLSTSKVLVVVFSTISGGTRAHVPSLSAWNQVSLGGTGGYARLGNILASAWLSRPGVTVYSAGSFRFAGLVGLAPEHSTAVAFELAGCQNGQIFLSGQVWDEAYLNEIQAQAVAIGQSVRGVLAVGVAEGQHGFQEPPTGQSVLTQTSVSGFFSAPFSVVGAYKQQLSNDPMTVQLPFDGPSSKHGVLLFNVLNESNAITSVDAETSTDAYLSYPSAAISTSSYLHTGSDTTQLTDARLDFEAMTTMSSTDACLGGTPSYSYESASNLFNRVVATATTDAKLDQYFVLEEIVVVELLGAVKRDTTTDALIVNSREGTNTTEGFVSPKPLSHLTDAYVFAGQTVHLTDALLQSTTTSTHTTSAATVSLVTSTATTDSYIQSLVPPSAEHTTDTNLIQENIIGMTGWELRDHNLECSAYSPYYSPGSQISVTSAAQRPGSQGGYGLRIDNVLAGVDSYWIPKHSAKGITDYYSSVDESYESGTLYPEVWTSMYFRCNTMPTGGREQLLSDAYKQIGFDAITHAPVYGWSWWLGLGSTGTESPGFKMGLYSSAVNPVPTGGTRQALSYEAYLNDTSWHFLEVRLASSDGLPLSNASVAHPFNIEVYLDRVLVISASLPAYSGCFAPMILGPQQRLTSTNYQVDIDDMVISTNRLSQYDLSVIAKPAKADGSYTAWTGTPADTYADVATIPYDVAKYQESTAINQRLNVKVYSGADADPYLGKIHAVSFHAVQKFNTNSLLKNFALTVRQGSTDLTLHTYPQNNIGRGYHDRAITCSHSPIDDSEWADTLYDFEMGVQQVLDSGVNRVVLLAANLLVSPFSNPHTTDAMLSGSSTLTHTTDASIGRILDTYTDANIEIASQLHNYSDAYLVGTAASDHDTDAAIIGTPEYTHTTDAITERLIDHTTDAVVVSVRGSGHSTDYSTIGSLDTSHDADAYVWIMVDLPHDTDSLQYRLVDLTVTGDSFAQAVPTIIHSGSSLVIGSPTATHTTTALRKSTITGTATTNALKFMQQTLLHTTSSTNQGLVTGTITTSSAMGATSTYLWTHSANALAQKLFSTSHTTDAFAKKQFSGTHSTNAILFGTAQIQMTANSWLARPTVRTAVHTADSTLSGTVLNAHTANSLVRNTYTQTHTTSAATQLIGELSHLTDSLKYLVLNRSSTTNAVIYLSSTSTTTSNSLLGIVAMLTNSSNSVLYGEVTYSHTTTSILFGPVTAVHTANSLLQSTITGLNTSNAYLAFEKLHSTDAMIGLAAQKGMYTASSLFGFATGTHTTTSLAFIVSSLSHTTSSSVSNTMTAYHVTSAALFGTSNATHTTDSKTATESLHSSDADVYGATSTTHATGSMLTNDDLGIFEQEQGSAFEGTF